MKAPLESPVMKSFVDMLDPINKIADESSGFIWRLKTEEGNSTGIRAYPDEMILFNLSVWRDIESFKEYVYKSDHGKMIRDKKLWFENFEKPQLVMWWIRKGTIPEVKDARLKFELLEKKGPTKDAFTFKEMFNPLGGKI